MIYGPCELICECGEVIDVYPYEEYHSRNCPVCGKLMSISRDVDEDLEAGDYGYYEEDW